MLAEAKIEQLGITIDVYQREAHHWVASGVCNGKHIVVESATQGTALRNWKDCALSISIQEI